MSDHSDDESNDDLVLNTSRGLCDREHQIVAQFNIDNENVSQTLNFGLGDIDNGSSYHPVFASKYYFKFIFHDYMKCFEIFYRYLLFCSIGQTYFLVCNKKHLQLTALHMLNAFELIRKHYKVHEVKKKKICLICY